MKRLLLLLFLCLPLGAAVLDETTFEAEADPDVYTNWADSSAQACSGSESALTSNSAAIMAFLGDGGFDTYGWFRFYVYVTAHPSEQEELFVAGAGVGYAPRCRLYLETDGTLTVDTDSVTDTSTETIPTASWTMIELECEIGTSSDDYLKAWINGSGTPAAEVTGVSTSGSFDRIRFLLGADNTVAYYVDDVTWDDADAPGYSAGCGDTSPGEEEGRRRVIVGD